VDDLCDVQHVGAVGDLAAAAPRNCIKGKVILLQAQCGPEGG